jgi:hypothetical protein
MADGVSMGKYVWAVRISLLGVAAILLAAAVQAGPAYQSADNDGDSGSAPQLKRVRGVTVPGGRIDFWLDREERPREFRLQMPMTCTDQVRPVTWTWVDGPAARFTRTGASLKLRDSDAVRNPNGWRGYGQLSMRLRISDDEVLVGVFLGDWHVRRRGAAGIDCGYSAYFAAGPCKLRDLRRVAHGATTTCR